MECVSVGDDGVGCGRGSRSRGWFGCVVLQVKLGRSGIVGFD